MKRFNWILGALGLLALGGFGAHAVLSDVLLVEWEAAGGVGALLVLVWLWLDREELTRSAMSRGAQYSAMASVLVVVAAGVAVALNVLASRYDKRFDITATHRHALSDQTQQVLAGLTQDVEIHAFFAPGLVDGETLRTRLDGFLEHSTRLTVTFHDPVAEPLVAREFDITTEYGTVVLKAGEQVQRLESRFDEESLVNALVRLTSAREHVICFSEGHEEVDPDDETSAVGMGAAVVKLESQNYTVRKVFPAREGQIPADCEVLVIGDPQVDWHPAEREMMAAHVASGRSVLVLVEPTRAPGLVTDLSRYNINVGDDIVLEQNPNYQLVGGDISYVVLAGESFDFHPITNPIRGAVLLRVVRSVSVADASMMGIQVQEIAKTSAFGWAERDYMTAAPQPDPGTDRLGPVPVVAVAEVTDPSVISVGSTRVVVGQSTSDRSLPAPDIEGQPAEDSNAGVPTYTPKAGAKVVVVGDVDFATNELLDQFNNRDFLLNTIAWLVGEDAQISIRGEDGTGGRFNMTESQFVIVLLLAMLVAPGMTIMGAVGAWRDRRSR